MTAKFDKGYPPTDLNRDVWQYVEIDGHTKDEAMQHFGMAESTVNRHVKRYKDMMPLPDDYVAKLRNRAKRIAEKALDVLEDNMNSDKPETHAAIQVAKGTGVLVERTEVDATMYVTDADPKQRFSEVLQKVQQGTANPDIDTKSDDLNIIPPQIADTES